MRPRTLRFIVPTRVPAGVYKVEYMPSYDLYFVRRASDGEIVLRTSYRSEAALYNGIHMEQQEVEMSLIQRSIVTLITCLMLFYAGYVCGLNDAQLAYERQLDVIEGAQE